LCIEAGEKSPRPEWQESLFLALAHGHPGLAAGPVDRGVLLAMHRQAWNIAGLSEDDPWKELLKIADPVERAAVASKTGFPGADLSSVISRRWRHGLRIAAGGHRAGALPRCPSTSRPRRLRHLPALARAASIRDDS
jgi:hypothetical protein